MELFTELQSQMEFEQFKVFIDDKKKNDEHFLQQTFWMQGGKQLTILNYLIMQHETDIKNLVPHMEHIIQQGASLDLAQPVHLAFQLKKQDLIAFLLHQIQESNKAQLNDTEQLVESHSFGAISPSLVLNLTEESGEESSTDSEEMGYLSPGHTHTSFAYNQPEHHSYIDSRDEKGRTLVSHAIELANTHMLNLLLDASPDVNQATDNLQPLHEAVKSNFSEAVTALIQAGAQINNPCGAKRETSVILSARHGAINAMSALLQQIRIEKAADNPLDAGNSKGTRAIDLLCKRLDQKKDPTEALRGIAMLLCHGASAPRSNKWRSLLQDNRKELIAAVAEYKTVRPDLCVKFYRATHDRNHPLHEIIYADRTFGTSVRHFFGRADNTAFLLEALVSKPVSHFAPLQLNHDDDEEENSQEMQLAQVITPEEPDAGFEDDEKWFADFVQRYDAKIKDSSFFNPYSQMRWDITRGIIANRAEVESYCDNQPNSRSARIRLEINQSREAACTSSLAVSGND